MLAVAVIRRWWAFVYGVSQGAVGGIPLEAIFKGILPFLLAVIAGTILMILFPQIIVSLPDLMY